MRVGSSELVLDFAGRRVLYRGEAVRLSRKAFDLLQCLVRNRDRAVSKTELQEMLWPKTFVVEANLSNLVSEIRSVLQDDPREPRLVRTVHGFGYAFCGAASKVPDADPLEGPAPVCCWLEYRDQRVALNEGEHLIGRGPRSVLFLDSRSVSQNHARVTIARGAVSILDLGSTNGTYVGDERIVSAYVLRGGDRVRVGSVTVTIRVCGLEPTERLPPRGADEPSCFPPPAGRLGPEE